MAKAKSLREMMGAATALMFRLLAQPQPKMIGHVQNLTSTEFAVVWDEPGSLCDSLKP